MEWALSQKAPNKDGNEGTVQGPTSTDDPGSGGVALSISSENEDKSAALGPAV